MEQKGILTAVGKQSSSGQVGRRRGPNVIPEYTAEEECKDRTYRYVNVGGDETVISMAMIEPYKKLVQHAGKEIRWIE